MIWFLQLTSLIADKTIEDKALVMYATIVKWALFNSKKELVEFRVTCKYNIKINNHSNILVRSSQLLDCFSQFTLLLVGLHVCQVKDQSFPTLIVIINFKRLETHLPAFTIFDALTDGYPKVCNFIWQ